MDSSSFITSKSTKDIIKDAEESVAFLDSMLAQSDAFEKAHALYRSDDGEDANSDSMIEAFECKGYTDANVISDSNASGADLSESQSSGPLWESYRMEKDNRATMESGNGDENDVGSAFNAMLRDLCNDIMYFSLRMCDVTHTKLCKISSALKVCREKSLDESNSITEGDGDFSSSEDSQCSHQCMQITRVAIAVDTIRLLLSRYDERKVVAALTTSTRKVLNRFTLESGVEPLVGFPATLTTTNIATVLLDARRLLVLQNSSSNGQWMSMQSRKNVKKSETRSPKQASADRNGKVHIGSHKDTGTTHPSPQSAKRSILHRDGDHILLKEHLFRYQSRPKAQYGLSNFKISSQPNDTSSTAAIRRQKAMQFSKKLTMVHILNGEIVADNDPRIEAGKQQQQPINRASSNIHTMSYGTVPSTNSETPPVRGEASFCTRMMRNLRLDQSITIPGFRSIRSRQVKIYKIALTALLVFLFGWKILIFIAIGFILSS